MNSPTKLDAVTATRLDPQNSDGLTRLDTPAGNQSPVRHFSIPSDLESHFRVISAIPTQGAEADIYVIEAVDGGKKSVLKLYRRGLRPKVEVIEMLQACSRQHVVEIESWGESDGQWYEILEYAQHGTLRAIFQEGGINEPSMQEIVGELLSAIAHVHEHKIIHRDLKPENILVRKLIPLELMLADFGIASLSDATQHFTTKSRTIKYGAPEAAAGAVGTASDYWSLGLLVLEGLTGKHPFDGLSDLSIAVQLATRGVDSSEVTHPRWRSLCRGLLTRDPKKRWSCAQVTEWLDGGSPEVANDEPERPSQKPYKFVTRECWTAPQLALEFGRNWLEGEKHLARNLVLPWLRDELRDQDAANHLIDLTEDRTLNNEDRLVRLIATLGKGLPPVWRSISLDRATLITMCVDAMDGVPEKTELLQLILKHGVLDVWGQSGNEDCALWSSQWQEGCKNFPALCAEISSNLRLSKPTPDLRTFSPVLLLMILSQTYRDSIAKEYETFSKQATHCAWLSKALNDKSIAALLAVRTFKEEAISLGDQEMRAKVQLEEAIRDLEHDHADLLAGDSSFKGELEELRATIEANDASRALARELPQIKRKLFEASRQITVTTSFKRIRANLWVEVLADALLVASLVVGLRIWMGLDLADDGFGFLFGRTSAPADGFTEVKIYLVLGWLAVTLIWVTLRSTNRRLSRRLFGK